MRYRSAWQREITNVGMWYYAKRMRKRGTFFSFSLDWQQNANQHGIRNVGLSFHFALRINNNKHTHIYICTNGTCSSAKWRISTDLNVFMVCVCACAFSHFLSLSFSISLAYTPKCAMQKPGMNNILSYLSTKPNDLFMGTVRSGDKTHKNSLDYPWLCNIGCRWSMCKARHKYEWVLAQNNSKIGYPGFAYTYFVCIFSRVCECAFFCCFVKYKFNWFPMQYVDSWGFSFPWYIFLSFFLASWICGSSILSDHWIAN